MTAQQNYCLADIKLAQKIKAEIKSLVCAPYANFYTRSGFIVKTTITVQVFLLVFRVVYGVEYWYYTSNDVL